MFNNKYSSSFPCQIMQTDGLRYLVIRCDDFVQLDILNGCNLCVMVAKRIVSDGDIISSCSY